MMRNGLRWLVSLALCLIMTAGAMAEPAFIPQMANWDLETLPLDIMLSAETMVHMPFDEERTAQLDALLRHMTLNLQHQALGEETWNRMALRVDGDEVLTLSTREMPGEVQVQTSFLPEQTFVQQERDLSKALNTLLGDEAAEIDVFGMDGSESVWLDDGRQLLNDAGEFLNDFKTEKAIKTSIQDMGTARLKQEYVVPKTDAQHMADALVQACPEGPLRTLLASLTFTGQQKLLLWRTGDGEIIRAEYTGKCGLDSDHMREVSLLWRMRRDGELRDDLTFKSPAITGRDRNTLSLERVLKKNKSGAMRYTGKFTYEWVASGRKTKLSGEMDLTSVQEKNTSHVTGSLAVSQLLPDAKQAESIRLTPDLLIGNGDTSPILDGTLLLESLRAKNVLEQVKIAVQAKAGEYFDWEVRADTTNLDSLAPEQVQLLQQKMQEAMAATLIPRLVLLPQEDTLYLSAGLSEEVWQNIVDAAQNALE